MKGEVLAVPLSGKSISIAPHQTVVVKLPSQILASREVLSVRPHGNAFIIAFYDVQTREEAAALRNSIIEVDVSALPDLGSNTYYHHQIIGLSVVTAAGEELGKIVGIMETGSNDVYSIRGKGKEYLIPAISDVIESIDISAGIVTIRPMDGLLD